MCMYVYIYIYNIARERERERESLGGLSCSSILAAAAIAFTCSTTYWCGLSNHEAATARMGT